MNQRKINKLVTKLKISTFELYKKGQLPPILYKNIMNLGIDTPVLVYEEYMELTQHYLRIPNYYTRFKQYLPTIEVEIRNILKEKGILLVDI